MFETSATDADLVAADALPRRATVARDAEQESRALDDLIGRINARPDAALQALVETVVALCGAGSAGISLLQGDRFVWPAIAGAWAQYVDQGIAQDASPCGVVIARDMPLLFDHPARIFPNIPAEPPIAEALLVPLRFNSAPRGTLWAMSHDAHRFDAEDARILERLGLVATALEQNRRDPARLAECASNAASRVRDTLAVMRALIRRSDEVASDAEAPQLAVLSSRLAAYAEGVGGRGGAEGVDMWSLVLRTLEQHGEAPDQRIALSGPEVRIAADHAGPLALALHELIENALEHGSLSYHQGSVDLVWTVTDSAAPRLDLHWTERAIRPAIDGVGPRGFGLELLLDLLPDLIGAETSLDLAPAGAIFRLTMPIRASFR